MKNNRIKATLLAVVIFLGVLLTLTSCGADETASPSGLSIVGVTYKPFASGHRDKFSLGDFDSPYLVRLDDYTKFVASNSSILLNDASHEVTKTDYRGGVYVGIDNFSFSDYTSFISTNTEVNIKVNLVEANGTYTLSNETIVDGLLVTGATNIYTWQDLQGMKHDLGGRYQLMNDVSFPDGGSEGLGVAGFEPVGDDSVGDGSDNFTGSFSGNNHTIVNLSIDRPMRDGVGIWGVVHDTNSVIKDFVLDHAGIEGLANVGAVVGGLTSGMVSNVAMVSRQNKSVSGTGNALGGLVGFNGGTVAGYATGRVSGTGDNVGGLVGFNGGKVVGYAIGRVSGNDFVGGLVGFSSGAGATVNGYATGAVSGMESDLGGLVGYNEGILRGYATGRVSGTGINLGGLVGRNLGTVNGYWDIGSSMRNTSAGGNNVVGISAIANVVYDSTADTYTDSGNSNTVVFTNAAFTNNFTLPGASATWPTLDAASSFVQP